MQTNKEFLDVMGIRPEDGFAAVEMRRVLAEMHRKPMVLELETHTVGEPVSNFFLPWDTLDFVYRLEKRLGVTIPRPENYDEIPEAWRAGPAVEMPLGKWMKIALRYFIEPIGAEIKPPENWTPLEPEGQSGYPMSFWQSTSCYLSAFYFVILPVAALSVSILAFVLDMLGLLAESWANKAAHVGKAIMIACWVLPSLLFLAYCFLFGAWSHWGNLVLRRKKAKPQPIQPVSSFPQLLGTLTFHGSRLELTDDEQGQGGIEIVPGDYRFFLVHAASWGDRPEYAVLTTLTEPPETEELIGLSFDGLKGTLSDDLRKTDIVIDSGVVGVFEASPDADWIPGPSRKTVAEIRQRADGTVCGLKLYPTYGDGDYQVFVRREPDFCTIVLELVGPDEDEGRPSGAI